MKTIAILIVAVSMLGCGGDGDGGKQSCPAELGSAYAWTYAGNDENCAAATTQLNAVAGSDEACVEDSATLDERECTATIEGTCGGATIEATCLVGPSGDADCDATVADLVSGLSCELRLIIR